MWLIAQSDFVPLSVLVLSGGASDIFKCKEKQKKTSHLTILYYQIIIMLEIPHCVA